MLSFNLYNPLSAKHDHNRFKSILLADPLLGIKCENLKKMTWWLKGYLVKNKNRGFF